MALPQIKLDERSFQDLVDEAKLRIPRYCPEWTNHNVSDPGVTLIELFAYMVDQLLYQVNRVPEKNYRAFLDMIGVRMAPPNPARAEVTFRLSGPQPNPLVIARGTEIATVRTEGRSARIFTTESDLVILPPALKHILISPNSQPYSFTDLSGDTLSKTTRPVSVFPAEPGPGNAFYLGFDQNIARNTLVITLDSEKLGVGINPDTAPLVWEYWDELESNWKALEVMRDTTGGLTLPFGEVELPIPVTAAQREIEMPNEALLAWWIRCRYTMLDSQQPGYNMSPVINSFRAYTIGGTIPASHSQIIRMEELGRSSGEPGQHFTLHNTPVLTLNRNENETILIAGIEDQAEELWQEVPDFADSGPADKHFVCDYVTGEISFGPAIRNPTGQEEQRGAVPPYNSRIVMAAYRTGGGTEGNVGSQTITVLKSSLPYVASVNNLRTASGGTNAESLEHALMRGPSTLRARNRAVTAEDFEVLTRQATSGVARVRCLTPGRLDKNDDERPAPGQVVVMIVPEVDEELRELRTEHLTIPAGMRADITDYLDERRLLTTQLELATPKYMWITIQARIKTTNPFVNERVKREAERRLYRFIRPVNGGPDPNLRYDKPAEGWPWGRALYASEIFPVLQLIEGVEYVEKVEMFPVVDLMRGQPGPAAQVINPGARGLLCSYRHQVVLV